MSRMERCLLISIAVVIFTRLSPATEPSTTESPLKGAVKSADGKPMEGVAVSARADGKTFTTTVYTGRNGDYHFPPLEPPMEGGQYKIWAQAVGFEAGRAATRLSTDKAVEQDFTLQSLRDFGKQMSGVEWMASLPEDTPQDRRIKRIMGVNCTQCHPMGMPLQNRFDATGWSAILNFMEKASHTGAATSNSFISPFIHGYKEGVVAYLSRVRGPNSSLIYKPLPRLTGASTQIVVTEYDVSTGHLPGYLVVNNGTDWSLGTPSRNESSAVHDVEVDREGYVWIADNISPERTLGKLDPKTGRVTDYTHRGKAGTPVGTSHLVIDGIGDIWIGNGVDGSMDKFDPRTEKFHHFPRPKSLPGGLGRLIDIDSKGNIWNGVQGRPLAKVDQQSGIKYPEPDPQQPGGAMKLDPKTGEYTFYKAVTPALTVYGVEVDALDNVWFTQPGPDRLGIVDGRTGKVSELSLSSPDDVEHVPQDKELASKFEPIDQYGPPWQKGPRRQASDKNGTSHYVTLSKSNKLAKIDIRTRKVTEYLLPYAYSFPYMVAVDKHHMVWVSALNADRFFKFNPNTEQFTAYPLPTLGTDSRYIAVDNSTDPPTVWLAYYGTSKTARIQFRTPAATHAAGR